MLRPSGLELDFRGDGTDAVDVALARQKLLAAAHASNPLARLIFARLAADLAGRGTRRRALPAVGHRTRDALE